jgi:hypothetical protein
MQTHQILDLEADSIDVYLRLDINAYFVKRLVTCSISKKIGTHSWPLSTAYHHCLIYARGENK